MSFLSQVTTGKIKRPHLVLEFGPDGIGKSTFAADAPKPIFIGAEKGTASLDVARFPQPNSFDEVLAQVTELATSEHPYKTLAIDSLDWIEPLVWAKVISEDSKGARSIEDVGGGFGKGYVAALNTWRRLIDSLSVLQEKRGLNVILIAHSHVKKFEDPSTPSGYERYQLKLNDKAAALFREYVDVVLFMNYETFVKENNGKGKGIGDGARFMFTERRPAFDAKNRYGLPFQMPLSWQDFDEAVNSSSLSNAGEIKALIIDLINDLKDQTLISKVKQSVEQAGEDASKLDKILNRVRAIAKDSK